MVLFRRLLAGVKALFRSHRVEQELDEELRAYLDASVEAKIRGGMARGEASRAAHVEFGGLEAVKDRIRDAGWETRLEGIWRDVRYAARTLSKSPAFAATAVLTLALGIGANTAAFSVIHGVLLRDLPYPHPEQLVRVGRGDSGRDVSLPEFQFWKEQASSFASAAGYRGGGDRHLAFGSQQEWIWAMRVTADFLRTLGVAPALGREFSAEETRSGGPQAIVLSDGLWRRTFGADPDAVGRVVTLDNASYVVVGVLPASFWFPQPADALVPLQPTGTLEDGGTNTGMIARLKSGVNLRQAEAEMPALTAGIRRAYPGGFNSEYRGLNVISFQRWLVGDVQLTLLLVFGAVGALLLIACSNLASLLFARLAARKKEIAMRLALGCSRARLLRQFLLENMLLTTAGGIAGVLGAIAVLDALVAAIPFNLPTSAPLQVDVPVLAFTIVVAFATGLAFSVVPILSTSGVDLQDALKTGGRSDSAGDRQRTRSVLVVSEVAFSVTLLVAAALLSQSLYRLHQERLGFSPQGLTTFATPFDTEHRRSGADQLGYESALMARFQTMPGVRGVAAIDVLPLNGFGNLPTQREGHPEDSIGGMEVRTVTPAYFQTMGIPVRRGRSFADSDAVGSPPVILVNETLARQWWPIGDPLGDRVVIGRFRGRDIVRATPREVVGVVGDTKGRFLQQPPLPTVYVPAAQTSDAKGSINWVLRADFSPALADAVRRAVAEIDPRQRVVRIQAMEEVVASTTSRSRFDAWLFGSLAGLALLLTVIGVYGVLSFSVARRTNEIGTRMALGASRANVLRMVLKQGLTLVAVGLVLGLGGALAVSRFLTTLLFGVRPTDPSSFLAVSALLLGVGILASYLPARRATLVDPMAALRSE